MPTGFRILCTHEGAAPVKDPSCLEQCARARERSVFCEKAGLRSVVPSEVIPCRHSGCGFSQTTNSFYFNRRSFKVGTTVGDGNAFNNR
ncbi:hypothetical protein TNCV_3323161 [Trichonephila clavipes]|nr:hypothetical protein TNCV_3323161 [Trichonephila clavipes]